METTRKQVCEKHGEFTSYYKTIMGLEFWTTCPVCGEEQADEETRQEEESKRRCMEAVWRSENIEPEFYAATLENYRADSPSQKKALQAVVQMVNQKHGKVLLLGANGVGKTHLACGAIKKLGGIILSMYEITTRVRASYTTLAKYTELEIMEDLAEKELLVIDEIGRTKNSDAERNWLSFLIDKRHTRGLPTILISNRHLAKSLPQNRQNEAIECFFENDIISRFQQDTEIIEIDGADRRRSVGAARTSI